MRMRKKNIIESLKQNIWKDWSKIGRQYSLNLTKLYNVFQANITTFTIKPYLALLYKHSDIALS